jgi:hypothetical protein
MTWFRREAEQHPVQWLRGVGDSAEVVAQAITLVENHLRVTAAAPPDHPQA